MVPSSYKLIYSQEQIEDRIKAIAKDLNIYSKFVLDSTGKPPIFLCLLEGGLFFYTELLKHIPSNQVETSFCKISIYEERVKRNKPLEMSLGLDISEIKDRSIILVDDILDTGDTLNKMYHRLRGGDPKAIIAVVLIKRERDKYNFDITDGTVYRAFNHVGEEWFVGYGMDDNGLNRNLLNIYSKEDEQ